MRSAIFFDDGNFLQSASFTERFKFLDLSNADSECVARQVRVTRI